MRGKDNRTPYWKYNCESCMRCAALCPQNAIEAGHSWGIILYFITAVPVSAYLFSVFGIDSGSRATAASGLFAEVVNILYFYPAIFISYFGFSLLIKVPFFNALFTRTTLTHLPFWGRYREPGTKLRDLK